MRLRAGLLAGLLLLCGCGSSTTADPAKGRILFVGASYTAGLGASGPAASLPDLVAAALGDPFTVDAFTGTGYQARGPHHEGTFAQRLAKDPVTPAPRIVVLHGGRDDLTYPAADEYAAALATIRAAQQRFPSARVVVLGPVPADVPISDALTQVSAAIGRAAATAHAGFVDAIAEGWITRENERGYAGAVKGHPNDAGYAFLADRLVGDLPAALASTKPEHGS